MKKHLLPLLLIFVTATAMIGQDMDPILFDVAGEPVRMSEFKYIYEKNNKDKADYSEGTLSEYMSLYKKFKLKVRKAKDMKLDTIPALIKELAGYRRQLAKSYLVDNEVSEKLVREVYDRRKEDHKIAHIFFEVNKGATEAVAAQKMKKATVIYNQLKNGGDWDKLCKENSEDKSSFKTGGMLGYFQIPMPNGFYELESAMCSVNVGEVAAPVRTNLGIHIVKLVNKRAARGEIEVAHIMVKKKLRKQTLVNAKSLIDSIYTKLKNGEKFEELAKKYSQDKKNAKKGGYLGFFGISEYEPIFEKAAFDLKKDGAYSKVIETQNGYHIIKRISKQDDTNYDIAKKRIKNLIIKDQRFAQAKTTLVERIKTDGGYKLNRSVLNNFIRTLKKDFYSYGWKPSAISETELFNFGGKQSSTLKDFTNFLHKNGQLRVKRNKGLSMKQVVEGLLDKFVDDQAISFEEKNLEAKYPDFKSLMREYEEGILLFEATKINVWDRASRDTTGLQKFYNLNKQKYVWEKRANVEEYLINTDDKKKVKKIAKCAKKSKRSKEKLMSKFNKKSALIEVIESLQTKNSKMVRGFDWKIGGISKPKIDSDKKRASFKRIVGFVPGKMKTLQEARGYVIADYQDYLEKIWIQQLQLEYPIKVDSKVFKSMIK